MEATFTMCPARCATKWRADSRAASIAPSTFVSHTRRMSSALDSSSGAKTPMPALLIRTL